MCWNDVNTVYEKAIMMKYAHTPHCNVFSHQPWNDLDCEFILYANLTIFQLPTRLYLDKFSTALDLIIQSIISDDSLRSPGILSAIWWMYLEALHASPSRMPSAEQRWFCNNVGCWCCGCYRPAVIHMRQTSNKCWQIWWKIMCASWAERITY